MSVEMTPSRLREFLMSGTLTGKLATVRADGRPHVAPIWYVLDGDDVVFMTHTDTVKGRNLARDGRVSIAVDDQAPPYAFAIIEGTASLIDDLAEAVRWATVIGGRYMGVDRANEFGERNGVPGELVIRVSPTKVIAFDDTVGY